MPGFFESMKRLAQGKPVFDVNDEPGGGVRPQQPISPVTQPDQPFDPQQPATPVTPPSPIQKGNSSTFPVVYVKHINTHLNGATMEVRCRIRNNSPVEVILDRIRLLHTSAPLGTNLRPGEEKEFAIYRGPRMQNNGDHEALLDYKTKDGDYFEAVHDIEFNFESDRTYSVEELHLKMPIRDIYG